MKILTSFNSNFQLLQYKLEINKKTCIDKKEELANSADKINLWK